MAAITTSAIDTSAIDTSAVGTSTGRRQMHLVASVLIVAHLVAIGVAALVF